MFRLSLLILSVVCLLSSCLPEEPGFQAFRKSEVQRLLSNLEIKYWALDRRTRDGEMLSLEDCSPERQLIFKYTVSATDKDSVFYINHYDSCANFADTLSGFWYIAGPVNKFNSTDSLILVWAEMDSTYFKINSLTPVDFEIETYFSDSLREAFSIMELDSL